MGLTDVTQDNCGLSINSTCPAYASVVMPKNATASTSGTATGTAAAASSTKKSGAELTRKVCGSSLVIFALATVRMMM